MHFRATGLVASVVSTESCIVCPAVTCELRNCVIIIDAKAPGLARLASQALRNIRRSRGIKTLARIYASFPEPPYRLDWQAVDGGNQGNLSGQTTLLCG